MGVSKYIVWMQDVGLGDVARVGGKNASLGELMAGVGKAGVNIPGGFIVTAHAYRYVLEANNLNAFVKTTLKGLDVDDVKELAKRGKKIRDKIASAKLPPDLVGEIVSGYRAMEKQYGKHVDVAVRSSATAEDLPDASFAGQQETYLGIQGADAVLKAVRHTFASLFNDRAISYRVEKSYSHIDVALSVGVQKMVRAGEGTSGVMFTLDTETGFKDIVLITASYGLGELIVQGRVSPDEYIVFKPTLRTFPKPIISKSLGAKEAKMVYARANEKVDISRVKEIKTSADERARFALSDREILTLAKWADLIEKHYTKRKGSWSPMDIEWAKDKDGTLYILQARPETVQVKKDATMFREYLMRGKPRKLLAKGISVGHSIVSGRARVIHHTDEAHDFKKGEILVTKMTDPDWGPIMKRAVAIVTDSGGRTSHAAIVSRELGIPAIVGAHDATKNIKTGDEITIDVSGSEGRIYPGKMRFTVTEQNIKALPKIKTKLMLNLASPDMAFGYAHLPVKGVGLAREEFIIASYIGIHPLACLHFKMLPPDLKKRVENKTRGWNDPKQYYIDKLAFGIAKIAAAFYPNQVIVRFSDFKSNEYAGLIGGDIYEPKEENPMIGWRGASRYYDPKFRAAFALEIKAFKKVREEMGLTNVIPMVPFCRTLAEAEKVLSLMKEDGLVPMSLAKNKKDGVKTIMMCEIPSNVILAEKFLNYFDGFSIGSNDLTQLSLGLDRDSGTIASVGNENDPAIRKLIGDAIAICKRRKKYSGICGQGPSDLPDFGDFLVRNGIESMSLNPDSVIKTLMRIAKLEKKLRR
ncbi:phosphoenolpyruvate synthase [Candidatus Kaiserbacteria bacterium]|nr:phosphoenolpyruvate synthase [Candidatus Kaiserbacteria bacterium]